MDTTKPKRPATFDVRSSFAELLQIVQDALKAGLPAGVAHERFEALLEAARAALDPTASFDAGASLTAWAARTRRTTEAMRARPPRKARPVEVER